MSIFACNLGLYLQIQNVSPILIPTFKDLLDFFKECLIWTPFSICMLFQNLKTLLNSNSQNAKTIWKHWNSFSYTCGNVFESWNTFLTCYFYHALALVISPKILQHPILVIICLILKNKNPFKNNNARNSYLMILNKSWWLTFFCNILFIFITLITLNILAICFWNPLKFYLYLSLYTCFDCVYKPMFSFVVVLNF